MKKHFRISLFITLLVVASCTQGNRQDLLKRNESGICTCVIPEPKEYLQLGKILLHPLRFAF